jgi:serine/threonine protein kinase
MNIINLIEIYEGENTFYMILEYLKGKSLHDVITKSHRDEFSFDII